MSVASLGNYDPLPRYDVESAVYVLLKVLTQKFVPPVEQQRDWAAVLKRYQWDNPDVKPYTPGTSDQHLSLPLPAPRWGVNSLPTWRSGINSSDYDEILSSLEDLVQKAIDAVRSVDVSSLLENWV
jgi:hypothetical protein